MIRKTRSAQVAKGFPGVREQAVGGLQDEEGIDCILDGGQIVGAYEDAGEGDGEIAGPDETVALCAVGYAAGPFGDGEVVVPG